MKNHLHFLLNDNNTIYLYLTQYAVFELNNTL